LTQNGRPQMDPYDTPESENARPQTGGWTRRIGGFLIVLFIALNLISLIKTFQVMSLGDYAWTTKFGVVSAMLIATNAIRGVVAALYFLSVRWFYWVLVLSMLVVYLIPTPLYPISFANSKLLLILVVLMGLSFAFGQRHFLFPWRGDQGRKHATQGPQ